MQQWSPILYLCKFVSNLVVAIFRAGGVALLHAGAAVVVAAVVAVAAVGDVAACRRVQRPS